MDGLLIRQLDVLLHQTAGPIYILLQNGIQNVDMLPVTDLIAIGAPRRDPDQVQEVYQTPHEVGSILVVKHLFVDITGISCVNCREMEARVWSDPRVQQILRDDYVLVALYTDDKTKVPENEWVTTAGGKVLKDIGRINSYIAQTRFGVNGQPNYLILGRDGQELVPKRAYNLDVEAYIDFLKSGVEAYNKTK